MPEKLRPEIPRPETTDKAGKSRPSGARKGKARKSRQVTTDTTGKKMFYFNQKSEVPLKNSKTSRSPY